MGRRDPLVAEVERAARALGLPGRTVLVAASGGVDSTVLAHALHAVSERLGLGVALGHVNHGLRGAASDADQAAVLALAAKLGVPVAARRVAPGRLREGGTSRARPTLQEAARTLRYAALAGLAREAGASHVATAHTLDDQAETVLLRLLRGTGPSGLGGIPERSRDGLVVRPLLRVPRAAIERWARERGLSWREDASNRDPAYARARLRTEWLRGLGDAFNPRWLRAIGDLAEAQRRESEWIEAHVGEEARLRVVREPQASEGAVLRIACDGFAALPEALARRLVRRVLHEAGAGRDVSRRHVERTLGLLARGRTGARLELPGGLVLERGRGFARLCRADARTSERDAAPQPVPRSEPQASEAEARASLHDAAPQPVPRSEPQASEAEDGQGPRGC